VEGVEWQHGQHKTDDHTRADKDGGRRDGSFIPGGLKMAQQITTTRYENTHQKRVLKAKLAELLGASTRIEDLRVENLADPLDQIKSALDREMTMNQLDARAHLVQHIRAALDAISEGTYGFCESCEDRIPLKRLKAVPWARRCVRCQMDVESQRQGGSSLMNVAA